MRPRGALGGQGTGPCARKRVASPAAIQFNIIYIMRTYIIAAGALLPSLAHRARGRHLVQHSEPSPARKTGLACIGSFPFHASAIPVATDEFPHDYRRRAALGCTPGSAFAFNFERWAPPQKMARNCCAAVDPSLRAAGMIRHPHRGAAPRQSPGQRLTAP